MKCNQSRPGFELVSPCPFPMTITITSPAPPLYIYTYVYVCMCRVISPIRKETGYSSFLIFCNLSIKVYCKYRQHMSISCLFILFKKNPVYKTPYGVWCWVKGGKKVKTRRKRKRKKIFICLNNLAKYVSKVEQNLKSILGRTHEIKPTFQNKPKTECGDKKRWKTLTKIREKKE